VVAIGSVKDLAAEGGTHDESGIGEAGEFALDGADAGCDLPGDLAGEEGLVGGSEEERQDLASGLAEEEVPEGWGGCTHFEYNCTHSENSLEESERRVRRYCARASPLRLLRSSADGLPAARKALRAAFLGHD
jgi:hypothetical protein